MGRLGVAATNRASFYLYTVLDEIDRLAGSVRRAQTLFEVIVDDQFYREVILDHYKNPRNYGVLADADASAEGQNPLCGDEIAVSVKVAADGETIEAGRLRGPGLRDLPGRDVDAHRDRAPAGPRTEIAALPEGRAARERSGSR